MTIHALTHDHPGQARPLRPKLTSIRRLLGVMALLLLPAWSSLAMAAAEGEIRLTLMGPDEDLIVPQPPEGKPPHKPPMRLPMPWMAVSLQDGQLVLQPVAHTRVPVVKQTDTYHLPPEDAPAPPPPRHALAVPDGTLLAAQMVREMGGRETPLLKPGRHPSLIGAPELLHDRFSKTVSVAGQDWQLKAIVQRRADGAIRAGSLNLELTGPKGQKRLLNLSDASQPFSRQELLWVGQVLPGQGPDLLIRQTLLTGQQRHYLRLGEGEGAVQLDPDQPHEVFTSGVDSFHSHRQHPQQVRPMPEGRFGVAAFSLDEQRFNEALAAADAKDLPVNLDDSVLVLDGERLRFSTDFLPTAKQPPNPRAEVEMPDRQALATLRVTFRGKTQVIALLTRLDGGFKLQVDKLQGQPAIRIDFWPHYNNEFVHHLVWDPALGRFVRLAIQHHQGC